MLLFLGPHYLRPSFDCNLKNPNVDTQSVTPQHTGNASFHIIVGDITGESLTINVKCGIDMYSLTFQSKV